MISINYLYIFTLNYLLILVYKSNTIMNILIVSIYLIIIKKP
jgi:hypothetical protein